MNNLDKIIIVKNWLNFISSYFTTQANLLEMMGTKNALKKEEWYEFMANATKTVVDFLETIISYYNNIVEREEDMEDLEGPNKREK